jgi:sulfide dehydrogenase [flavocytochrome c] flavoprotein chain
VVSPGIDLDYDAIPGWGRDAEELIPHAFKPGRQMQILKARLDAVPDGGLIVLLPPPNPSRCPPAPYERASMMAHALKSSGRGAAKIVIVDPKPRFTKMALFLDGWDRHYKGMIEWLAPDIHEGVKEVDPKTSTVVTGFETYNAALVNLIPAQKAGVIAHNAKLTDASGFCPIDAESMRSILDPAIFVLGDSCASGDMPKAAFAANGQAKVAAAAICTELASAPKLPAHYANTCWSLLAPGDCVKLSGRYEPGDGKIKEVETVISRLDETADTRTGSEREAQSWYAAITEEMFG